MKVLQICNKPPYPPQDGGAIGMHNVTQGLIDAGHTVKVLSVNTPKHFVDINNLPDSYRKATNIEFGFINTDLNAKEAFLNLFFSKRSYNIIRFENSDFKDCLVSILKKEEFDIIQIESIFLNYYVDVIRSLSKAKVILRSPNVEFMIWQRMAEEEKNPFKRTYLKVLAKRIKNEERICLNKFDAVYTVTQNDLEIYQQLGCKLPMASIPTGIDVLKDLEYSIEQIEYPSIFHIGALDWMPNQEGLIWFLENVWMNLNKENPELKFYIAGRGDATWFDPTKYPNVVLLGEIDDAAEFIKSKAIMIVPLFSGSGMRVKIIEGMTLGKAIVSTSIGIEGIMHQDKKDVFICDSANEFISAIEILINEKSTFSSISINANRSVTKNYSNRALTEKLIDFLKSI